MESAVFRDLVNIFRTSHRDTSILIYNSLVSLYPNAINVILHMSSGNQKYILQKLDVPLEDIMECPRILFPEKLAFINLNAEQLLLLIRDNRLVSSGPFYLCDDIVNKILAIRDTIPDYKPMNAEISSDIDFNDIYRYITLNNIHNVPKHQYSAYNICSDDENKFKNIMGWMQYDVIASVYTEFGWKYILDYINDNNIPIDYVCISEDVQLTRALKINDIHIIGLDLYLFELSMKNILELKNKNIILECYGDDQYTSPLESVLYLYLTGKSLEPNLYNSKYDSKIIDKLFFRKEILQIWQIYSDNAYIFDFIRHDTPRLLRDINIDDVNLSKLTHMELSKLKGIRTKHYSDIIFKY